jgi:hypothetical protein
MKGMTLDAIREDLVCTLGAEVVGSSGGIVFLNLLCTGT